MCDTNVHDTVEDTDVLISVALPVLVNISNVPPMQKFPIGTGKNCYEHNNREMDIYAVCNKEVMAAHFCFIRRSPTTQ